MWMNPDASQARAAEKRIGGRWLERSVRYYEKAGASGQHALHIQQSGIVILQWECGRHGALGEI